MILTTAVTLLILGYMWVIIPLTGSDSRVSMIIITAVLALSAWGNLRSGSGWGFERGHMRPAFRWVLALTLPTVAVILALGWWMGTFRPRDQLVLRFALLLVWGLMQQFVLQTVILREARQRFSRRAAIVLSAGIFAIIHFPNPFLTLSTFVAGLAWCWIYERHPNLLAIAVSHAAASMAAGIALGPGITGGMKVGVGYLLRNGIWF